MGKPPQPTATPLVVELDEQTIAAYEATIAHHGSVIRAFSSNFVNVFALFNAGGFSVAMAILPTELGTRIFATYPAIFKVMMIFFALGFIASSALMVVVFQYSLGKYCNYRDELIAGRAFTPKKTDGSNWVFVAVAWLCLFVTFVMTIAAIGFSLGLLFIL